MVKQFLQQHIITFLCDLESLIKEFHVENKTKSIPHISEQSVRKTAG